MNITLKQARAMREALIKESPDLSKSWNNILQKENESKDENLEVDSKEE